MFDHIADYALKNVWCTPGQDKEAVLKLPRVSPKTGVWNRIEVMRVVYTLPEQGVRFHVFQIGQLNPLILGLTAIDKKWVSFSDACNNESLVAYLYTAKGYRFPLSQAWYFVTADKNVLVAVKEQTTIGSDLGKEDFFIRVYSNAYFNTDRADSAYDYIKVKGATVKDTNAILALQNEFNNLKTQPGLVTAWINGYQVAGIDLITTKPGDVVEYMFDGSVYRVLDFAISDLSAYTSTMDGKKKFLLHSLEGSDTIDFVDDIDVILYMPGNNGRFKGVYFHQNQEDAFRMVTHCDYGIAVPYIEAIAAAQDGWDDILNLRIRLHVRKAGWKRSLVYEASRIKELYKMPSSDVLKAMTGVDSTVSPWRAEHLEATGYCEVMRYVGTNLPPELVQDCFGYNALSKLIGDTPTVPRYESEQKVVDMPLAMQALATAYEYDANGQLIDWYQHIAGTTYGVRNPGASLVEVISGTPGRRLDEIYGQSSAALDPATDYRFYVCNIVSGVPDNHWVDVTGTDKYTVLNGAMIWNVDQTRFYTMVRGNRNFLAYTLNLKADRGFLKFSLVTEQLRDGKVNDYVMQVPMGELDVWLNKRALIEGLDYIVKFPEITILNKKYMDDPLNKEQVIDIRFTGFCRGDLTREQLADKGFINHGLLSNNNRFDLRDDKVQRIVVDGQLYARDELKFAESDSGVTVPDVKNGKPYLIRDIVVPMRGLVVGSTYDLRSQAQVVDKSVSDYLSTKLPGPVFTTPNAIEELYPIYSPFFANILFDLKSGAIDNSVIQQHYSSADVMALCKNYESLLPFDPTQQGQEPDADYVVVHPHPLPGPVEVDLYQYRFLASVIKLYMRSLLSMGSLVTISS